MAWRQQSQSGSRQANLYNRLLNLKRLPRKTWISIVLFGILWIVIYAYQLTRDDIFVVDVHRTELNWKSLDDTKDSGHDNPKGYLRPAEVARIVGNTNGYFTKDYSLYLGEIFLMSHGIHT